MKQLLYCLSGIIFLTMVTIGCNSQNTQGQANSGIKANSSKVSQKNFKEGVDYTVMTRARIEDKFAFSEPVEVFSFLIPQDWKYDGDLTWVLPGKWGAGNYLEFHAQSPDGAWQFTLFPSVGITHSGFQMMNETNRYQSNERVWVGQPVTAEEYLYQYFLPQLGNPEVLSIVEEEYPQNELAKMRENSKELIMLDGVRSVDIVSSAVSARVKWNDGSMGIIGCKSMDLIATSIDYMTGQLANNHTNIIGSRIAFRFPASGESRSEKLFATITNSMRENDAWRSTVDNFWKQSRMQSRQQTLNQIKMMNEYSRRSHQDRMAAMDANMRSWEARQSAQDQQHSAFIKSIRGVETYQDATGTYEMSSNYNHAWSRGDGGSFIMTDNPNFDPSSVFQDQEWKQMQRVK